MKISLMIDAGVPQVLRQPEPKKKPDCPSLEEEIRSALQLVESGHDSNVEWRMLKKFYIMLRKAKQTPRVKNLREMIEPALNKYGYPVGK